MTAKAKITTSEIGTKFGKRTVISHVRGENGKAKVICKCQCGAINEVDRYSFEIGEGGSCGCDKPMLCGKARRTHGRSKTKTYVAWIEMRKRCENPKLPSFKNYGKRGISVCPEWSIFENFLRDMGECPNGMSIERDDVNGNYEPSNCRWIPLPDQAGNKRNTLYLTFEGVTKRQRDWEIEYGLPKRLLAKRLKRGFTPHQAIYTPYSKNRIK
jgi:hypothetical protein